MATLARRRSWFNACETLRLTEPLGATAGSLELWGGVECTVARIGDVVRNQIVETGHQHRPGDLDRIAALGIRTMRYPVLWETVAPDDPEQRDWSWHDERLQRLRSLGIRPIAGLVHHGSGPRYTSLVDPGFPEGLAKHAGAVAARFPWIDHFTPVNEPLTTARFSGLYGHWFPHGRDDSTFLRILVTQCRATLLAMRAIRRVTPAARLVQTEDLGRTFSTPELDYQAEYENERRWLSFDLLCGRVDRSHPWHAILCQAGARERDLDLLLDGDGAPDIIGINHYLTSDRYLDQRRHLYPKRLWGTNGRSLYADVEAVRTSLPVAEVSVGARLREAWARYGRPLAVTEVHHGCTREEQLRWLMEVWRAGTKLRREGVDLRAITIWSLFGAVDWNTLLTQSSGFYEPGAFDTRAAHPRSTMLARASESLARTGEFDHPVLGVEGWWHRPDRFYGPARAFASPGANTSILIAGGTSAFGEMLKTICRVRGLDAVMTDDFDMSDEEHIAECLDTLHPWAVVDAASVVPAAMWGTDLSQHRRFVQRQRSLARHCARRSTPLVTFSSPDVFDGSKHGPYVESDPTSPTTACGRRHVEVERCILQHHSKALIIRNGPILSSRSDGFLNDEMSSLAAGQRVYASKERVISPAYLPDFCHAVLDLLLDEEHGIWHLASRDAISPHELIRRGAETLGLPTSTLEAQGVKGERHSLSSLRGHLLPPLSGVIDRWASVNAPNWLNALQPAQ